MNDIAIQSTEGSDPTKIMENIINEHDPSSSSWSELTDRAAEQFDIKSRIETYWKNNTRVDGRLFYETRHIQIQYGILTKPHAYGSSLIRSSNNDTFILVSVSLLIGQPNNKASTSTSSTTTTTTTTTNNGTTTTTNNNYSTNNGPMGDIQVSVSSSSFYNDTSNNMDNSNGINDYNCNNCNVLQSYLQRILNNSQYMNLEQLNIISNKSSYRLCVNVHIIQSNGILYDICLLGCIAALYNTDIPTIDSITVHNNHQIYLPDWKISKTSDYNKFQFTNTIPISLTALLWKTNDDNDDSSAYWILDPTLDEIRCMNGYYTTIIINAASDDNEILYIDSSNMSPSLSRKDMTLLIRLAHIRGKEILKTIFT